MEKDKKIEEMVKDLRKHGLSNGASTGYHSGLMDEAADVIEQLQAEVERLIGDINLYKQDINADTAEIKGLRRRLNEVEIEVARKIFEEFESLIKLLRYDASYSVFDMAREVAELKKKYIGGAGNEQRS